MFYWGYEGSKHCSKQLHNPLTRIVTFLYNACDPHSNKTPKKAQKTHLLVYLFVYTSKRTNYRFKRTVRSMN